VGLAVDLFQSLGRHVGVELRGLEGGVTEDLLDAPEIGAALQQVCGGAVAESVGAQVRNLADLRYPCMDDAACGRRVESSSADPEEECRAAVFVRERRAPCAQPVLDGADGRFPYRNDAFSSSLAQDADRPTPGVQVVDVEPAQFTDADARSIEDFQYGQIAEPDGALGVHGVQ
jgi:hypothetical protein